VEYAADRAQIDENVDEQLRLPVLICPATGVRQHFYLRFAEWLADQGHDVLVFDYRGIGLSLSGPLKGNTATLAQWGQQDQVAAVNWLLERTERPQLAMLGHSAGGQMIGLLPNHHRIARLVGVAASTGWFKLMRPSYRIPASLVMNCLLPAISWGKGYAPTSKFGLGENLPTGVARQWARWCSAGGYATNAVRRSPAADFHAQVTTTITAFYACDDRIANTGTVKDLLRTLPNATKTAREVKPSDHGLKHIGHIDWFRASHKSLWPMLAAALH
jgi:predicted alpha/beta hydrolase